MVSTVILSKDSFYHMADLPTCLAQKERFKVFFSNRREIWGKMGRLLEKPNWNSSCNIENVEMYFHAIIK